MSVTSEAVTEEMSPAFARAVGERLRDIRRQQRLSLQAVEEQSGREFKASVLGAYERGERIISVLRLQRLAALYGVPVDQLLPRTGPEVRPLRGGDDPDGEVPLAASVPVRLDLTRLEALVAPERDLLRRYIGMVQIQRGDFNGRVITIRAEDVKALARVFGRDEGAMRNRLEELGVLV
ncbi:MAG TPA: transcriptional regulator [Acidimicrobiales bacterium]|nr:transcriptional regulator [Acidimicrobiales bacterium]